MKENILWTLAFFGLWCLLRWGIKLFRRKERLKPNTSLVLQVYNWEDNVERLVRFIASSCYFNDNMFCPVDVVIVDVGSTDHTLNIVRKLARSYAFIKVIDGAYVKKSEYSILDYAKQRCQGDVVLLIDTTVLSLRDVEQIIKFYFNDNGVSSKALEITQPN